MKAYKDASIHADIIYLTNSASSFGWATYDKPIPIWDHSTKGLANFSSHFQFSMGDDTGVGDGITFFMAPFDAAPPIKAFGEWLGLFNYKINGHSTNQIVAVEFDAVSNDFDPDGNHVGVDVNSVFSNKNVSLSANKGFWNWEKWDAWVDYNGGTKMIEVFLLYNPSGNTNNISKPGKPILSYKIDLSESVPEKVRVGLSGSTGELYGIKRIFFWKFLSQYSWNNSTGSPVNEGNNSSSVRVALISALAILFALCGFIFVAVMWYRRRKKSSGDARKESDVELDEWFSQGPRRFSYAELSAATRNFSEDEKLGHGGFGGVYKGILPGQAAEAVAVKRISEGSKQGRKEYISEVTIISKLRQRNLVQLLGWCHQKGELLLVYEYGLPNGSLDKYIFGEEDEDTLDWDRRYSIACDIASALLYLHEEWDQRVVHRDDKASNVMLDSDFNAKLGDFGLARTVERDQAASHTTVVAGTLGYLAPECYITGKASPEADVYSFGAVMLEIACGRRPVDRTLVEHNSRLVEWVWDLYGRGKLLDAADKKLGGYFNEKEMELLMLVELLCSHPDPTSRPRMREALKILKREAELPSVPLDMPVAVYSQPVNRRGGTSGSWSSGTVGSSVVSGVSMSSSSTASSGPVKMSSPLLFDTGTY